MRDIPDNKTLKFTVIDYVCWYKDENINNVNENSAKRKGWLNSDDCQKIEAAVN